MSGVIVDSGILIEVLRERKPEIVRHWIKLAGSLPALFYSPVSLAEIGHGMREREADAIQRTFWAMTCVPIGEEIGRRAGYYLRRFHASHAVELGDAFIAATAAVHDLELWTLNRKHYPMRDVRLHGSRIADAGPH